MSLSYINYFLPLILIFSSLKIFGYVLGFIFFFPFVLYKRKIILDHISNFSGKYKLVLYYFYFQIIQTIIGTFVLNDIRILIYWFPFYIVCIYIYYTNLLNLEKDRFYRLNIFKILYKASLLYFILYFIFNIFSYFVFGNPFQIQNNLWMGSSAAFNISSILIFSIYNLWNKENFKINSKYNYSFIFFILISNINDSRLGALYIGCFIFFLILKHFQLKRFISLILLLTMYLSSYQIASYYVGFINSYVYHYKNPHLIKNKKSINNFSNGSKSLLEVLGSGSVDFIKENSQVLKKNSEDKLSTDTTRFISLIIAKEKFIQSNLYVKIFGSGLYTSRLTINDVNDKFGEKYKDRFINCPNCLPRKKVNQLQGFVAILLDTGLIGIGFTSIFYFLNLKNIILFKSDLILKLFYLCLLFIHFLSLFIGYPLNSIIYILCLMPFGLFNLKE